METDNSRNCCFIYIKQVTDLVTDRMFEVMSDKFNLYTTRIYVASPKIK